MRVLNGHLKQYILKCLAEGYVNFDRKYAGCLHFWNLLFRSIQFNQEYYLDPVFHY